MNRPICNCQSAFFSGKCSADQRPTSLSVYHHDTREMIDAWSRDERENPQFPENRKDAFSLVDDKAIWGNSC